MRTPDFPPMDDSESDVHAFDFVNVLLSGETIVSTDWEIVVLSGSDPTPSDRFVGPALVDGTVSKRRLAFLAQGATYQLTAIVHTSLGNIKAAVSAVTCET
jgi:hypothetical protein